MIQPVKETPEEKLVRESKERFLTFDQQEMIDRFHLQNDADFLYIRFLDQPFRINRKTGELLQGERSANSTEMSAVFELLTRSTSAPAPIGTWASIAQLCTNTTTTDLGKYARGLSAFEDSLESLRSVCEKLGGTPADKGDVSYILPVFENIPVWFQYWEKDEEFPASVQFLWDSSISLHFRWATLWNIMDCIVKRMNDLMETQN